MGFIFNKKSFLCFVRFWKFWFLTNKNLLKPYILLGLLIFDFFNILIRAQSYPSAEENLQWYPLKVENFWVYENRYYYSGELVDIWYTSREVSGNITLENGKSYFIIKTNTMDTTYLRIDSLTAIIYAYNVDTGEDLLYEELSAVPGDTVCYEYQPYWLCQIVQNIDEITVWDSLTLKKDLSQEGVGWLWAHSLVNGFGLFKETVGDFALSYLETSLFSCVIDNIVYGDTTVVSVGKSELAASTKFILEQNYPNPFNPRTKIKFTISSTPDIKLTSLKIYDILGNEIITLVNGLLTAGEYDIEFDATGLPNGVYFYRLQADSYIQTKKMILMK